MSNNLDSPKIVTVKFSPQLKCTFSKCIILSFKETHFSLSLYAQLYHKPRQPALLLPAHYQSLYEKLEHKLQPVHSTKDIAVFITPFLLSPSISPVFCFCKRIALNEEDKKALCDSNSSLFFVLVKRKVQSLTLGSTEIIVLTALTVAHENGILY